MGELASSVDPAGRRVVLDEEGWAHILGQHAELIALRDEIVRVVAHPDLVTTDPRVRRLRYWRRSSGPSSWLRVIVDFGEDPARIVTAIPNRKGPPEWPSALNL